MAKQSLFLLNMSSKDKTTTKRKSNNGRMISCNLKTDCWDAFEEEPSSPRVSCVGQIKRDHDRLSAQAKGGGAYHKSFLMKMLSCGTISHRRISADLFEEEEEEEDFEVVNVLDMDPPLPVVKCGVSERGCVNLWKRRCGGSLEGLQVGQIEKPL
ncbi:hypothetical protein QJS10_CPA06g02419 [Acorus calamus]|uniref:Uncharacterized protein n=1 Tax=Acorus calamus TaxID=4465 RepID=A0AAV9EIB0_ACOCL|nr:hypothetical protein QJS10_CPA06g02419 [Acorus calamus]